MTCQHKEPPVGTVVVEPPPYACIFCELERLTQQVAIKPDPIASAIAAITARALAAAADPHKPDAGLPEAPPKPCSRRLPGNCWCLLPNGHDGDCHGVTSAEAIGVADFGPKRAVRR